MRQDYHKTSGSFSYYIVIRQVEEELQKSSKLIVLHNVNAEVIIIMLLMIKILKIIITITDK